MIEVGLRTILTHMSLTIWSLIMYDGKVTSSSILQVSCRPWSAGFITVWFFFPLLERAQRWLLLKYRFWLPLIHFSVFAFIQLSHANMLLAAICLQLLPCFLHTDSRISWKKPHHRSVLISTLCFLCSITRCNPIFFYYKLENWVAPGIILPAPFNIFCLKVFSTPPSSPNRNYSYRQICYRLP